MKIYTLLSDSHKIFYDKYFYKSIKKYEPNAEIVISTTDQLCKSGGFYDNGWKDTMKQKVICYIRACEENMGNFFIWSDVDIEFYAPFIDTCLKEIENKDIAFQYAKKEYNAGFFICKCNEKTLKFFKHVLSVYDNYGCDQMALNKNINMIDAKYLSNKFWSIIHCYDYWEGQDFNINMNIVMAHAIYTKGIQNKVILLNKIKEKINKRNDIQNISIKRAVYGLARDVTEKIKQEIQDQKPNIHISNETFASDPAPGYDKFLYLFNDENDDVQRVIKERDILSSQTYNNVQKQIVIDKTEHNIWDKTKQ